MDDFSVPAYWWFGAALFIVWTVAVWMHGSWHRGRYTAKHEAAEESLENKLNRIRAQGGDVEAAFLREVDHMQAKTDAKIARLKELVEKHIARRL